VVWNRRARVRRRAEDRLEVFEVLTAVTEEEDALYSGPDSRLDSVQKDS
jgi:hypothetical protein